MEADFSEVEGIGAQAHDAVDSIVAQLKQQAAQLAQRARALDAKETTLLKDRLALDKDRCVPFLPFPAMCSMRSQSSTPRGAL